ncbi:coiled-coil domain-containing protein 40-like [Oncorhynchus tshawytscha]|uniref:coiled-coil domain-containing protein 40-like n=1 Tax=Oncorhynchus tshawytscha TaxID=74940 RepID=UPI000D09DDF3|nr:coiled-coil domain-containing protein 40-like [Oncorhynchus tshawytscha]
MGSITDSPSLYPPLSTRITKHVTVIERKQATINVYNKKIEQLVASTGHEDLGLLEIQASTLTKQLEGVGGEIKEQQQLWLLVRLSQEKQARIAALLTLQAQFTILQQRKVCTETKRRSVRGPQRAAARPGQSEQQSAGQTAAAGRAPQSQNCPHLRLPLSAGHQGEEPGPSGLPPGPGQAAPSGA